MIFLLELLILKAISDQLTTLIKQNAKTGEQEAKHTYVCTHIISFQKMKL
jgi:hypothetical protein